MTKMTTHEILGVLRNPHGIPDDVQRQARHEASDLIVSLEEALKNLRGYAEAQGIDTAAYPQGKPLPEMRTELLRRVDRLANFAHNYWTACEVGPERTWGANLYEIIRTAPRAARE